MGRKTAWFLVLCLAMVLLLSASVIASEQNDAGSGQDASDERQGAWSLRPGTFIGFLGDDDNEDWYKIELERGAIVSVNLAVPEKANFDLYLDPTGPGNAQSTCSGAGQEEVIYQYAVGQAGTCYIRVVLRDGEGEYKLTLGVKNQNDVGSGQDVGSNVKEAHFLKAGTFTGFLGDADKEDWYKIELERGVIVSVNLAVPETANFDLYLNPPGPRNNAQSTCSGVGQEETISQYAVGQAGTCYIKVVLRDGEGEYELTLDVENQNDAGSGQDASNDRNGASLVKPGAFTGFLGDDDDEDWYEIEELGQGQILSINLTAPEVAVFSLDLYRGGSYYYFDKPLRHAAGQTNAIKYVTGQSGTWCIQVKRSSGKGPYNLTIEAQDQDDAGSGQDASNEREGAYLLTPGTFTGFLADDDTKDWYEIEDLGQGQILSINLTVPETADFDLFPLHPPYMPEHHGTGQDEGIQYVPQQIGPQYFRIVRNSGEGEYQLTIEIQDQNDAGSGQDASANRYEALPVTPGTFTGFLMSRDKVDWYKLSDLPWRQLVDVDLTVPETATLKIMYYDEQGYMGPMSGRQSLGPGTYRNVIHCRASGDHTISVELLHGYGEYTFTVRSQAYEGDPLSPRLPTPDGVSIPFLKKDPSVASGSSCRGACGSGCPGTCQDRPDIVRCFPDPNDADAHLFLTYKSVIECGTHVGCREHDACFDRCAEDGEENIWGLCHGGCDALVVANPNYKIEWGPSWFSGGGPYDGYFLYSDPLAYTESEPGQLEYTQYRVRVATGDLGLLPCGEGTNAGVYLTLLGTLFGRPQCSSAEIELDTPNHDDFEAGNHEYFVVTAERFDSVDGIVLRHDNTGSYPGWYVDDLVITALSTETTWRVDVHRWLALDEEDGRLRVEFFTTLAE